MSRILQIAGVFAGTALMFMLWVVMIAVVLLPFTWLVGWWLGDEVALLDHPRRNAIVLSVLAMTFFIVRAFSPSEMGRPEPPERIWWWKRTRP